MRQVLAHLVTTLVVIHLASCEGALDSKNKNLRTAIEFDSANSTEVVVNTPEVVETASRAENEGQVSWDDIRSMDDSEAAIFLTKNCGACHDSSVNASFSGLWGFDGGSSIKEQVEKDIQVQTVYVSLIAKYFNKEKPMPPEGHEIEAIEDVLSMLKWLHTIFPELLNNETPEIDLDPEPTETELPSFDWSVVQEATTDELSSFFLKKCFSCHGKDELGYLGPFNALWGYDSKTGINEQLPKDSQVKNVFQALWKKRFAEGEGVAMPPFIINSTDNAEIESVLLWLMNNIPDLEDIKSQQGGGGSLIKREYICKNPVSKARLLERFTYAAFDRPARDDEISAFIKGSPDDVADTEFRQEVTNLLSQPSYRSEFFDSGLRKLLNAISQVPRLNLPGQYLNRTETALGEEFFQLVSKYYSTWSYDKFFRANTVMINENTNEFYGCARPVEGWDECRLPPGRSGFFTTFGYLSSIPTTFLIENNNYGRVAGMYLVLHGESLRPATNGPAGAPPRPLPECFKDKDDRERGGGPRGTVSVAKFGNVCQSCHLNRYVAAGSILFRPFSYSGKLYKPTPSFETIDGELWADAKTESWSHSLDDGSKAPVDQEFLETILSQRTLPTCIETPAGMKQVQSVNDLAAELLSDKPAVLKGFARHAHRAFLSSMTISDELLHRFSNRKTNLNNTIENLVAEYFSSETFACSTHAP